jgi:hypothetical protein
VRQTDGACHRHLAQGGKSQKQCPASPTAQKVRPTTVPSAQTRASSSLDWPAQSDSEQTAASAWPHAGKTQWHIPLEERPQTVRAKVVPSAQTLASSGTGKPRHAAASTGRPYRADASSEGRAVRANLGIELARQIPADFGRAGARFAVRANRNVATPRATIVVGSGHERKRKKDGDQVTEATCQRVRSFHAWFSDQRLTPYMAGRAAIRGDIINGRCLRDRRSCIHAPRCEGARSWEMNGGIVRWRCGPPPIGRYGKER